MSAVHVTPPALTAATNLAGAGKDAILEIEPRTPGEGFTFEDKTVGGSIPREYIGAVRRGVEGALGSGVRAGYPVVDV